MTRQGAMVTAAKGSAGELEFLNDGHLVWCSDAARRLVEERTSGLVIREGRLYARGVGHRRLQRALQISRRANGPVAVAFPDLQRGDALILTVLSYERVSHRYAATVHCTGTARLPSRDQVAIALGLSPAEAGLSLALARGVPTDQFAQSHSITLNTVRSQLAVIRKKTGARSQTQIASLIWMLADASL